MDFPGQADQALASETASAVAAWAGAGLSLGLLLRNFFVTAAVVWERLSGVVEAAPADAIVSMRVLHDAHCVLENWLAEAAATVSDRFLFEQRRLGSGEQRRLALVTDVVEGVRVDGAALGYDLSLEHLAIVAWGDEANVAVTELAQLVGRRLFFVAVESDVVWAWLGKVGDVGRSELRALRRFQPPPRTSLAIGEPQRGIQGFRNSHREALNAREVALACRTRVSLYRDVALEALVCGDREQVRRFVARELRGLAQEDRRAVVERNTLEAYFAAGNNASAAAAALGVKADTVAQRLRRVEQRIGPITARQTEIATALRLRKLLIND